MITADARYTWQVYRLGIVFDLLDGELDGVFKVRPLLCVEVDLSIAVLDLEVLTTTLVQDSDGVG